MSFQPLFPLWAVAACFLTLSAWLVWLEARKAMNWRGVRIAALLLALLSLLGLVLQPHRQSLQKTAPILLLTKGYSGQLVDSLRSAHPDWQVYRTADALPLPGSRLLKDLPQLTEIGPHISAIAGGGLPAYALEFFPQEQFRFFPDTLPTGLTELRQKSYQAGRRNHLEGRYLHRGSPVKLLLRGPAETEDSLVITSAGEQAFTLGFTPASPGRWLYKLLLKDTSGQVLDEQLLPMVVAPEKQLRVLILQAFPSFEIRYLKDFLAARGHAVAMRAQLSREQSRTEFANLTPLNLNPLDVALLEQFDVLLTDGAAYSTLSRSETEALRTAIQNGLGLLGPAEAGTPAFYRRLGLSSVATQTDTLLFGGKKALPVYPVSLASGTDQYIIHAGKAAPLSAYFYEGRGKVAFLAAAESYAWRLQGDSLSYADLWMPVLEKTARIEQRPYTIELRNDFPVYAGEPLDFRVIAAAALPEVYADSLPAPMLENAQVDDLWYGRTWPATPGWHQIRVGEEEFSYYAFAEEAWPSLALSRQVYGTLAAADGKASSAISGYGSSVSVPLSGLWFYVLFLLSAGFLWLAPKLA